MPAYFGIPAFQELPLAALSAVNAFIVRFPNMDYPRSFPRLVSLAARIEDYIANSDKQGMLPGYHSCIARL